MYSTKLEKSYQTQKRYVIAYVFRELYFLFRELGLQVYQVKAPKHTVKKIF